MIAFQRVSAIYGPETLKFMSRNKVILWFTFFLQYGDVAHKVIINLSYNLEYLIHQLVFLNNILYLYFICILLEQWCCRPTGWLLYYGCRSPDWFCGLDSAFILYHSSITLFSIYIPYTGKKCIYATCQPTQKHNSTQLTWSKAEHNRANQE